MHSKVKSVLVRCIDAFTVLVTLCIIIVFMISQGIILTSVINMLRLDTYINVATGVELVFLVFTLLWLPVWSLVAYNKKRR